MKLDKYESIVVRFFMKFNSKGLRELINKFRLDRLKPKEYKYIDEGKN